MHLTTANDLRAEPRGEARIALVKATGKQMRPVFVAWVLAGFSGLALPPPCMSGTVVLNSGKRVEVKSYKIQGQLVVLELQNGSAQAYAVRDVNLAATQAANAQSTTSEGVPSRASPAATAQSSTPVSRLAPAQPIPAQGNGASESDSWAGEVKITQPPDGRIVMAGPTPASDLTPAPASGDTAAPDAVPGEVDSAAVATPTPSRRHLAAQQVDKDIAALAEDAAEYVKKVNEYRWGCSGTTTGTAYGRGYGAAARSFRGGGGRVDFVSAYAYAGSWTVEIDNASTPLCRALWSEIADLGPSLDMAKKAAIERARRGGAWPGDVRSALHKYGIEWDKSITSSSHR